MQPATRGPPEGGATLRSSAIRDDIEAWWGFLPPYFEPALGTPEVLDQLWNQVRRAYLDNPLPPVYKEKVLTSTSRFCTNSYSLIVHACTLRRLGVPGSEVLRLLERTPPSGDRAASRPDVLARRRGRFADWPDRGSEAEEALVDGAVAMFIGGAPAAGARDDMRRVLGERRFTHLTALLTYAHASFAWLETYEDVDHHDDERTHNHLGKLLVEAPALEEFFRTYVGRFRRFRTGGEDEAVVRRVEGDMRDRAEELHAIHERAPVGIVVTDAEGRIRSANPAFVRMLGYEDALPADATVTNLTHPDDQWRTRAARGEVLNGFRDGFVLEKRYVKRDRTVVWARTTVTRLSTGDDGLTLAVIEDITEQRRVEEEVRSSEARFRALVESATDAVVTFDDHGRITFLNRAAETMFGYEMGELLEARHTLLVAESLRPGYEKAFDRLMRTGAHPWDGKARELRGRRRDGTEFPMEVATGSWEAQARRYFTTLYRDITERKAAEDALTETTRDLARMNQDLRTFARAATQDLTAPLRHIQRHTDVLCKAIAGSDHAPNVGALAASVEEMQQVVRGLGAFATAASRPFQTEDVDVGAVLDDVRSSLAPLLERTKAHVTADALPVVHADRHALAQVFEELLLNAVRFTGDGEASRIHVSATRVDGRWRIDVSDHGIGIAERYHARVFEMFQRLQPAAEVPGAGVGLTVVKHLVGRHGGHVALASKAGEGTRVSFTLPAARK